MPRVRRAPTQLRLKPARLKSRILKPVRIDPPGPAAVAEVVFYNEDAATPITVSKPAGFSTGQLLVAVHVQVNGALAALTAPSTGGDVWALEGSYDEQGTGATTQSKVWSHPFSGTESATWDFAYSAGVDTCLVLFRITGADTTPVVGVQASTFDSSTSSMASPTITPAGADDLLLCTLGLFGNGTVLAETDPSGMTDRGQTQVAGNFMALAAASEQLTSGAATGTRTWTSVTPTGQSAGTFSITVASVAVGGGDVPITLNDAGAAAEALALTRDHPETGSGSDALGLVRDLPETGSGSDALGLSRQHPESGSATDSLTVDQSLAITASDAGSGSDVLALARDHVEAGAGQDALALSRQHTEQGTGSEALSLARDHVESGTGADALSVDQGSTPITLAEAGSAAEALALARDLPDAGTGSEALGLARQILDGGTAADSVSVSIPVPASEQGSAAEALSLARDVPEQAAGTDALGLSRQHLDAGAASDRVTVGVGTAEQGTASDTLRISAAVPLAELATAAEQVALAALFFLAEQATGAEDLSILIPPPVPPPRWTEGAVAAAGLTEGAVASSGLIEGVLVASGRVEGSSGV